MFIDYRHPSQEECRMDRTRRRQLKAKGAIAIQDASNALGDDVMRPGVRPIVIYIYAYAYADA